MATLDGLKSHAVVDGELTDAELQLYLDAAVRYFGNAGVPAPEETDPLYDLGVYRLATFYIEHRAPVGSSVGTDAVPYGITGIILQLRDG